ncbi:perlucin [Magallana gigas]|uniref:perlucin n=1 Tax=Magallana gigas TaxID=29159 RepID=UPI0033424E29
MLILSIVNVLFSLFLVFQTSSANCPAKWVQHSNSCYLFETRYKLEWIKALNYCKTYGATLAEVETSTEDSFLKQKARQLNDYFWLGGSDILVEGEWVWLSTHAAMTYTGWHTGMPNNYRYNEHCLCLERTLNADWGDLPCYDRLSFICEKSAINVGETVIG